MLEFMAAFLYKGDFPYSPPILEATLDDEIHECQKTHHDPKDLAVDDDNQ